jgi:hypothetical protein
MITVRLTVSRSKRLDFGKEARELKGEVWGRKYREAWRGEGKGGEGDG